MSLKIVNFLKDIYYGNFKSEEELLS